MTMRVVMVACVLVVAACGGDDDGGDLGGDGTVTLREICQAIAEVTCDKAAECSPPAPENCVTTFTSACCPASANCDQEVASGGAAEQFQECLDDYADLSCAEIQEGESAGICQPGG